MALPLRPLRDRDVPAAVRCWNAVMVHDVLSEDELRAATAKPDITAFVAGPGDAVEGLVAIAAGEDDAAQGHILTVCACSPEMAADLIAHAEDRLRTRGATQVRTAEYGGWSLAPGIDLRYEGLMASFEQAGYRHTHTLDDMEIDLASYEPTAYQLDARQRAEEYGVSVVDWSPELAEPLRAFVAQATGELPAGWFWDGWERGPDMVVAVRGGEVVGYANYWPTPEHAFGRYDAGRCGSFGPIGVLPAHRGHGIGTWLLSESMLLVKRAGCDRLFAGWTNTPFYIPNGWHVTRQYAVWKKAL